MPQASAQAGLSQSVDQPSSDYISGEKASGDAGIDAAKAIKSCFGIYHDTC